MKKRLIVGCTGASGAPLAIDLLRCLRETPDWESHLICSEKMLCTGAYHSFAEADLGRCPFCEKRSCKAENTDDNKHNGSENSQFVCQQFTQCAVGQFGAEFSAFFQRTDSVHLSVQRCFSDSFTDTTHDSFTLGSSTAVRMSTSRDDSSTNSTMNRPTDMIIGVFWVFTASVNHLPTPGH